ncbi:MAG TPA: vitamin K epoxide reductase family protein, partial [Methylomirabilota bacterium]
MAVRRRNVAVTRPAKPDYVVVGLAAAGFAIAVYLTWLKWSGGNATFCLSGSGCDVVQASRYGTLLGLPTALWGALLYAAIGALAAIGLTATRWDWAFCLA